MFRAICRPVNCFQSQTMFPCYPISFLSLYMSLFFLTSTTVMHCMLLPLQTAVSAKCCRTRRDKVWTHYPCVSQLTFHIDLEMWSITFKVLNGPAPDYIKDLLTLYVPGGPWDQWMQLYWPLLHMTPRVQNSFPVLFLVFVFSFSSDRVSSFLQSLIQAANCLLAPCLYLCTAYSKKTSNIMFHKMSNFSSDHILTLILGQILLQVKVSY